MHFEVRLYKMIVEWYTSKIPHVIQDSPTPLPQNKIQMTKAKKPAVVQSLMYWYHLGFFILRIRLVCKCPCPQGHALLRATKSNSFMLQCYLHKLNLTRCLDCTGLKRHSWALKKELLNPCEVQRESKTEDRETSLLLKLLPLIALIT